MRRRPRRDFRPRLDPLDDRCLPAALTPAQVTTAYGLNAAKISAFGQTINGDGAGQIIAVIEAYHDPYVMSDLGTFDQTFGLPAPPTAVFDLAGSSTNDGWAQEETLDVEWAHAVAPRAGIIVVEARSDSLSDLLAAVNLARNLPRVSVVSMSWGSSEFSGQTSLDSFFTTPAGHTGVTFVAASGDEGAAGGAEWPASSADVLSVGGTTLQVSPSGTYQGESLWSGSSGGVSGVVPEPSYQSSLQTTGRRTTPDVAFDADPNTGVYVYTTTPSTGSGSWSQVGGTSLGAPAWAGLIAIADEGRFFAGKGNLDGATQTLPALYALPSSDFHKIAGVSSGFFRSSATVTAGLGTPNGAAVVSGLAYGATVPAGRTSAVTASTVSTTAPSAVRPSAATGGLQGPSGTVSEGRLDTVMPGPSADPRASSVRWWWGRTPSRPSLVTEAGAP